MPWTILVTGANDSCHVGLATGSYWSFMEARVSAGMLESLSLRNGQIFLSTSEGRPIAVDPGSYIAVNLRAADQGVDENLSSLSEINEADLENFLGDAEPLPLHEVSIEAAAAIDFLDLQNEWSLSMPPDFMFCDDLLAIEVQTGRQKIDSIVRLTGDVCATAQEVASIIEYHFADAMHSDATACIVNFWLLNDRLKIFECTARPPDASFEMTALDAVDIADQIGPKIECIRQYALDIANHASHI